MLLLAQILGATFCRRPQASAEPKNNGVKLTGAISTRDDQQSYIKAEVITYDETRVSITTLPQTHDALAARASGRPSKEGLIISWKGIVSVFAYRLRT